MNKSFKKHWPILGIALLAVVVGVYLSESRREILQNPVDADPSSEEGFVLQDIHYTQDDPDGGVKWVLDAEEATISHDRQFISFLRFRLKLQPADRPYIEISGRRGTYNKNSGEIDLREDLQGFTGNGYNIKTEHVLYKQKDGCLKTGDPVRITGPAFSLEGSGLYVDLNREILSLGADVTAVVDNEALVL